MKLIVIEVLHPIFFKIADSTFLNDQPDLKLLLLFFKKCVSAWRFKTHFHVLNCLIQIKQGCFKSDDCI